jgi:hypothetical protein
MEMAKEIALNLRGKQTENFFGLLPKWFCISRPTEMLMLYFYFAVGDILQIISANLLHNR